MKAFAAICALFLFVIGCVSDRTDQDDFASLHNMVKRALAEGSDCGPITTNAVIGGRCFEVKPQPRGWLVVVSERPFLTQKEWQRRYAFATNSMSRYMEFAATNHLTTNQPIDAKTAQRIMGFTNAFGLFDLPEWRYQNIGVDVKVQEVEVAYPGSEQDYEEACKRYAEITKLLTPYHRANTY